MDDEAIHARAHADMATRIQSILESPFGLHMKPLASHLAFETLLPAADCLAILEIAGKSRPAIRLISTNDVSARLQ